MGSKQVAEKYKNDGISVHAMLEIDMCGGGGGFRFMTDFTDRDLTLFCEQLVDEYCTHPFEESTCGYGCSVSRARVAGWRTRYRSLWPKLPLCPCAPVPLP